jgi:hypothetical protein
METPNKQDAQRTSNTLKSYLQNENYMKAMQMIENSQHKLRKLLDL